MANHQRQHLTQQTQQKIMIHFNKFKYLHTLIDGGIPEQQAKVFAEAQEEVLTDSIDAMLATKTDIQHLDQKIDTKIDVLERKVNATDHKIDGVESHLISKMTELNSKMTVLHWMGTTLMAGVGAIVMKLFF